MERYRVELRWPLANDELPPRQLTPGNRYKDLPKLHRALSTCGNRRATLTMMLEAHLDFLNLRSIEGMGSSVSVALLSLLDGNMLFSAPCGPCTRTSPPRLLTRVQGVLPHHPPRPPASYLVGLILHGVSTPLLLDHWHWLPVHRQSSVRQRCTMVLASGPTSETWHHGRRFASAAGHGHQHSQG